MEGYRTATHLDYAYLARLLTDGNESDVLVRSLLRSDKGAYPLLDISSGPYLVTAEGIEGFSKNGERCTLRIAETPLRSVELRQGDGEWMAPEMSSVLLVPK